MASVSNQSSPAVSAAAVTPTDNTTLTNGPCRAIYIGGPGDLAIIPYNDTVAVTFVGCYTGMVLPVMATSIQSTGTTATSIVALY